MIRDPLFLAAVLCLNVVLAEWLVRHTALRHLGSALLVIVITAIVANIGIIPAYDDELAVYSGTFQYIGPLGIFWLLLTVRLKGLVKVGLPLLILFLLGAVGTVAGVLCGMAVVGGESAFGEKHFALGGMFVGTYTGGSANFNAIALEYDVVKDGRLYAAAAVVDSAMTTLWMVVNVAIPRLFGRMWPKGKSLTAADFTGEAITGEEDDTETTHFMDLALLVALGALAVWGSNAISDWTDVALGYGIPSMLILTTLALLLAQLPAVARLRGPRLLGMFAVMVFLAVIGALCDVQALRGIGELGTKLMLFVPIVVFVHGAIVYGFAIVFRLDPSIASVASQANVGGGTSALALARSLGRAELVLPAILVGSLGTALGTYLGFLTAAWLR